MSLTLKLDIAWMLTFIGIFTVNDLYISPFIVKNYGSGVTISLYSLIFIFSMIAAIYFDNEIKKEKMN